MKNVKLFLVFVLLLSVTLLTCSCVDLSAYGITIPGLTQTCTVHRDINKDTICDVCGSTVPVNCTNHVDLDHDGVCDTNGCSASLSVFHYDEDHDGECDEELCTKTNMKVTHVDDDMDRKCDECGKKIDLDCECFDEDEDGYCDECGYEILPCEHVDEDGDGECDECGEEVKEPCDECVDANKDGKCDECGNKVDIPAVCEHADANFDGKCDSCKEKMDGVIPIYENGKFNYTIVFSSGLPGDQAMVIDQLISQLKGFGLSVPAKGEDKAAKETEYEIIFGTPSERDDIYKIDGHDYGMKGYSVQLVGKKIIVVWGSDNTFSDAVAALKESFLGIASNTRKLTTRYVSEKQNVNEVQDDYNVSTITLFGKDIKGFTIAANKNENNAYATATLLQTTLYTQTGYWLKIIPVNEATDKTIVIAMAPKNVEREGFYATFTDGKMEFISEYPTVIQNKVITFFNAKLAAAKTSGTLEIIEEDSFTDDVRYVYYKDYGAVGDGKVDDSEAIRAAHEYANAGGHKVIAQHDKTKVPTYYIGKMAKAISIKTDVDWGTAKFIIDDSVIPPTEENDKGETITYRSTNIFSVSSLGTIKSNAFDAKIKELNAANGIDASTFKSFDVELGQPLLIFLNNGQHQNYIRYGVNASDGASQREVILVDEHGNIDPTTPLMHDFGKITSYELRPIDNEPITIEGGEFYTKPYKSQTALNYTAYGRGINCGRSNVTFKNVKHFLIEEGDYDYNKHETTTDYGCPYGGFFSTSYTNNVTYDNCQFAAHIVYKGSNGAGMGTYDLSPGTATNVMYKNCYQEDDNFFNASGQNRWGVMGSSYCKNVTFLDCKLTRFDAHNGIHNAFIINTEIKMIRINGTGNFVMENCIMHSSGLVGLREDYGGFWDGNIILKNNTIITTAGTVKLFTNTWYNHYFGYPARYPSNIIIDGIKVYKDKTMTEESTPTLVLFDAGILTGADKIIHDYLPVTSGGNATYYPDGTPIVVPNKCQATPPERVIIRNCEGFPLSLPTVEDYPWVAPTTFEINQNTACIQHFDHIPDGKCDDCGANFTPCTEHVDKNNDGKCCFCGTDVAIVCEKHIDKELNGKCDVCEKIYVCDAHIDGDGDRICDKCGGVLGCKNAHVDKDEDGNCDVCTKIVPKCDGDKCVDLVDKYGREQPDCKCDSCKADMVKTVKPCDSCTDEDADGTCDVCSANIKKDE